jgi:hypothetical protein
MKEDKRSWSNVLDLKNEIAPQYGIKAIPSNFLLDKSGILIAKDLHNEELAGKLRESLEY